LSSRDITPCGKPNKKPTEADGKMTSACCLLLLVSFSLLFNTEDGSGKFFREALSELNTVTTQKDCTLHYCPLSRRLVFCLYYSTSTIIN
jgi:hypothetical protein